MSGSACLVSAPGCDDAFSVGSDKHYARSAANRYSRQFGGVGAEFLKVLEGGYVGAGAVGLVGDVVGGLQGGEAVRCVVLGVARTGIIGTGRT